MLQIFLVTLLSLTALSAHAAPASKGVNNVKGKPAQESFHFQGEWISPKIIEAFLPPASDPALPTVISIDLGTATGSNRFFGKVAVKDGRVSVEQSDESSVSYEWIGRSKNGKHVLVTRETSDGSMVPTDLAVFKIKNDQGVDAEGKAYRRVLLELDRLVILGDRAYPEVSLKNNRAVAKVSCEKTCESRRLTIDL